MFLRSLPSEILLKASGDREYLKHLNGIWKSYQDYLTNKPGWLAPKKSAAQAAIAFFSAEFGVASYLPNYSGGLGVLAGDYLKSAGDLSLPLVGIGLMYRQGYFKQIIDIQGWQREIYPDYQLNNFALELVVGENGLPLTIGLDFPDRQVKVQTWLANVGRIKLYFLDSDCEGNWEEDRRITDRLYGGDSEKRIQQEIILGIGGIKLLEALKIQAVVCHLNEGHSAFLALERIRRYMELYRLNFDEARELAAAGNIFTTHTPVAAGIDVFQPFLIDKYFTAYYQSMGLSRQEFISLGRIDPSNQQEFFNMAVLALRLSNWANGVSRLHGLTARRMWQGCWPKVPVDEIPIQAVTNGVHVTTWVGPHMASLYRRFLGNGWNRDPVNPENWAGITAIPDAELWQAHEAARAELIYFARRRFAERMKNWGLSPSGQENGTALLNPKALTIGFGRRFAAYKRPTLLFRFPERLIKLIKDPEHPVQIIFAGKAHPGDDEGKELIQQIIGFAGRPDYQIHVAFLDDYDIDTAKYLVQGVDLWLGNPRRPQEASSTSGMKAVLNGALHLSTLDGWWDEAWIPAAGWAVGNGGEFGNMDYQDQIEAESLFNLLEKEIVPLFYRRDDGGLPLEWLVKMKCSIQSYGPVFNTHRMVQEYNRHYYQPAVELFRRLETDAQLRARQLAAWKNRIKEEWRHIHVENVSDSAGGQMVFSNHKVKVQTEVYLGIVKPEEVVVELYYGPVDNEGDLQSGYRLVMASCQKLSEGRYRYQGEVSCRLSGRYGYNIRILPAHPDLVHPYIPGCIYWDQYYSGG